MQDMIGSPKDLTKTDLLLNRPEHQIFRESDTGRVREEVGRIFKPHELRPLRRGEPVSAQMHHLAFGHLSLSRLEYGVDVEIDPGRLGQFYLIQLPLHGHARIRCGGREFDSHRGVASLVSPNLPLQMKWEANAPQLILRIEAEDMISHCRQHMGSAPSTAPEFSPDLYLTSSSGECVDQLLGMLMQSLADNTHPLHHPLVLRQFKSTFFNSLLYGQSNTLSASLVGGSVSPASPYYVRRAEEFIRERLDRPLSIESIAEHTGVSVRTLHAGFRSYRGTTPMNYLRDLRLDMTRQELLQQRASVTEAALRWGFAHLGRFAQDYKRRFGESPSVTVHSRPA